MRRVHSFAPSGIVPSRERLLVAAGIPAGQEPSPRVDALLAEAVSLFLREARPRGVEEEVGRDDFLAVLSDGGRDGEEAAVDRVVPRARTFSLFAATLGPEVGARVSSLFDQGDAPRAFLLDAVAAGAAERLSERLSGALLSRLREQGRADGETRVLAYSPGYCGWRLEGQRSLFARLAPREAGIRLGAGGLMEPVKSVSGVLVAAAAEAHRFRPDFDFCDGCEEKTCLTRMASLRARPSSEEEGA
ncbi:hypothetical protein FBQ97_00220 [Acidobacteria bacterium ACD]|nr:MAG: hypothetical protein EDX89_16225 [Acidobacteriota bacterium]MCE7960258.1 hypothetical protein [Acidobacteria bacterium ACB2]MDL1948230.1 hypothetical protein [Acidobacteria bacterium ACD]